MANSKKKGVNCCSVYGCKNKVTYIRITIEAESNQDYPICAIHVNTINYNKYKQEIGLSKYNDLGITLDSPELDERCIRKGYIYPTYKEKKKERKK